MLNHLGALENALVRLCVTPGLACYGECRNNTGKHKCGNRKRSSPAQRGRLGFGNGIPRFSSTGFLRGEHTFWSICEAHLQAAQLLRKLHIMKIFLIKGTLTKGFWPTQKASELFSSPLRFCWLQSLVLSALFRKAIFQCSAWFPDKEIMAEKKKYPADRLGSAVSKVTFAGRLSFRCVQSLI